MNPVGMQGVIQQMKVLATQAGGTPAKAATAASGTGGFGQAMRASLDRINDMQQAATGEAQAFQAGKPGVALYDVMIDTQEARAASGFCLICAWVVRELATACPASCNAGCGAGRPRGALPDNCTSTLSSEASAPVAPSGPGTAVPMSRSAPGIAGFTGPYSTSTIAASTKPPARENVSPLPASTR